MPAGVKFSGWLEKTPAGAGVAAAERLLMPGGTKMETFCFLPFSSSVKSSGFKPVTGWPFLWVTTTSTTTSRVFARIVMVGTSAGAGACWALKIGPVARFKTRAEAVTIRKGKLHSMEPPGGASELGDYPEMYRVSDPVANLITTEDTGVHRGNATEKNGSASLPCERLCSLWFKFLRGVAEFFRRWTRLVVLAMSGNNVCLM